MDSTDTAIASSRESGPATPSLDSKATMDASRGDRSRGQARPPHKSGRGGDKQRSRGGGRKREMGRMEWRFAAQITGLHLRLTNEVSQKVTGALEMMLKP